MVAYQHMQVNEQDVKRVWRHCEGRQGMTTTDGSTKTEWREVARDEYEKAVEKYGLERME